MVQYKYNKEQIKGNIMDNKQTLTNFIQEQIYNFGLQDTPDVEKKLRQKFTRTLKELKIWQNAEKRLIGKKYTRVFTEIELNKLYEKVEKYLIKQTKLGYETYEEMKKINENHVESLRNMTYEEHYELEQAVKYEKPPISDTKKMEVMITALFEKFFTPLDIEQWEKDEELLFYTDPDDIEAVTSISYIQAQNRLKNPRSYYSEKK